MLNGAIVGFGEVASHGHWPGYAGRADVTMAAVVERTAERRAAATRAIPGVMAVASLDELAALGCRIDFVDICTPPALHAEPMRLAIERGWHVLCEKPFLLDPGVVASMRAAAAAREVAVMPVHNWKYAPILRAATAWLRAGRIGDLVRVEIETLRLKDCAAVDPLHPNWRRDPAIAGGGILMDHGWHAVYLALDWFASQPTGVSATLHRPSPEAAEDEARVAIAFGGGDADIFLSWNADARRNTVRLVGREGVITVADHTLIVERGDQRASDVFPAGLSSGSHHADWFAAMLPDVLAGFADRSRAARLFEEAATTLDVIRRAYAVAEPAEVRLARRR